MRTEKVNNVANEAIYQLQYYKNLYLVLYIKRLINYY